MQQIHSRVSQLATETAGSKAQKDEESQWMH